MELDCIVDLVFRGSDQHVAITTLITNFIALSIRLLVRLDVHGIV